MIISVFIPISKYEEESSWEYDCAWLQLMNLRKSLAEAKGTTDVSWVHIHIVHIT